MSPPAHPSRPFVPAATNLFKLLDKYKPEEKKAKKQRLAEMVRASAWDFGAAGCSAGGLRALESALRCR